MFQPFPLGMALQDGGALNAAFAAGFAGAADGIVAFAGGGQTGAIPLTAAMSNIKTVATTADSVKLPPSLPGAWISITNSGSNSLQVFSALTSSIPSNVLDTINGTAGATGVAVAAGKTAEFRCFSAGAWVGPVALA